VHAATRCNVAHDDEAPGLREANRRRLVGGLEHAREHILADGIGQKLRTDVATQRDHTIERGTLRRREIVVHSRIVCVSDAFTTS